MHRPNERSGERGYDPEVLPPMDPLMERLVWLMDQAVPLGGRFRIGLDGLLGLIPGVGDAAGTAISGFIILRAMQMGAPKSTIARMVTNVAIDTAVGMVPFVGDLFDFAFKSNTKNMRLYQEALRGKRNPARDWFFVVGVMLTLAVLLALPLIGLVLLLRRLL